MKLPSWKMILLILTVAYAFIIFYFLIKTRLPNSTHIPHFSIVDTMDTMSNKSVEESYISADNLPLREYAIKSSFNSAYDGGDVSAKTLAKRIEDGYRFIDLNVFSASGGQLFVGFSRDNAPALTSVKLTFAEAIETIKKHAFVKPKTTPEKSAASQESAATPAPSLAENFYTYPMIVHIRVYRTPESTEDIIAKIADFLKKKDDMYLRDADNKPVQINGGTPLSRLKRKLLFTMDIENMRQIYAPTNTPSIEYVDKTTQEAMRSFVNMISGGHTIITFYKYSDESIMNRTRKLRVDDAKPDMKFKTNAAELAIVYPHPTDNNANPDTKKIILNNTIQMIPMRAYIEDGNLSEYIKMFNDLKTPFVPLTFAYTYHNK